MNYKITRNKAQTTINCQGKLIDLSTPKVMGIINVTPDSFYKDSRAKNIQLTLRKVEQMISDGATFIDVGGMSSRPGSEMITQKEELKRILPTVEAIRKELPEVIISIDTIYAQTARATIEAGANIVNDISGGMLDEDMITTVAALKCPYILMHMKGTPQTMKKHINYENLLGEVSSYFIRQTKLCKRAGIKDIIIDLGFGFAKTIQQNFELLAKMETFQFLEYPILTGISRKSTIWKTLKITPEQSLNGTTALHMVALQNGTNILRVHDVKEAIQCITLFEEIKHYA